MPIFIYLIFWFSSQCRSASGVVCFFSISVYQCLRRAKVNRLCNNIFFCFFCCRRILNLRGFLEVPNSVVTRLETAVYQTQTTVCLAYPVIVIFLSDPVHNFQITITPRYHLNTHFWDTAIRNDVKVKSDLYAFKVGRNNVRFKFLLISACILIDKLKKH